MATQIATQSVTQTGWHLHDVNDVLQKCHTRIASQANVFFLNATKSQKGKAISNPRAAIAQTAQLNAGIKMQALKRVQFRANNLGAGVGPTARVSVTGRVVSNFL